MFQKDILSYHLYSFTSEEENTNMVWFYFSNMSLAF